MTFRSLLDSSLAVVQRSIIYVRRIRPSTWIKIGGVVVVAGLCATEIALRGDTAPQVARARVVHEKRAPDARPSELDKLVAMTHADNCEQRSKAAEALAAVHSKKATAALKRLANSSFKDESASPGVFSCSSRRAAQRALDQQGT